ncbi:MAG: ribosome biogenesis GTPase Der [Synergistaceae bacterium]|jgi:GTP-binding protein|nr:ribosome biogenesis GTPase Der [Synergistaceae bacterium]
MPIVAIVGRPNVGKSSLFNRMVGRREAIVDDRPGVTRDRLYGEVEWNGHTFYAVDTGGILGERTDFSAGIEEHVKQALSECDLAVMVVDGITGVTAADESVALLLRRSRRPVVVAVNKVDDPKHEPRSADAYALGFEDVIGVSALHKRNLDELLDRIAELLPEAEESGGEDEIRMSIVGRPNVGKSSLLNRLAKEERALVSPIAGTTRDPVDTPVVLDGRNFRLIDTAGLRKKTRMDSDVEYYSFVRTLAAVDRSDVAILLMEAGEPCTDIDKKLAAHVVEKGRGLILVLNKWDMLPKKDRPGDRMTEKIRDEMPFLAWAPILFVSALNGRGVGKIAEAAVRVFENRRHRIPTNALNRLMRDILAFDRLPSNKRGKALKVYYCLQSDVEPPTFVFFVNDPEIVDSAFENHILKELRLLGAAASSDFSGSPIRVYWRGKTDKE